MRDPVDPTWIRPGTRLASTTVGAPEHRDGPTLGAPWLCWIDSDVEREAPDLDPHRVTDPSGGWRPPEDRAVDVGREPS